MALLLIFHLSLVTFHLNAQTLTLSVPAQVSEGEQFRVQYSLNTSTREKLTTGQFPEGIELLYGPSRSESSSFQMINGHTSSSSSVTFSYMLCANKQGTFTIPAASIMVDGKKVQSRSAKVTVVAASARQQQQRGARVHDENEEAQVSRPTGNAIGSKDLFITVTANKKRVHEQEPILLTYKVYTLVDLTQLDGKMPDLKGFHTQEIPLPQQKSFSIENYNGRNYKTVTWSQYIMYPQMTGKLEIPSITFNGLVVQRVRSVDPFEAFFNGGSGYTEVKKAIKAPSITIQVDPLPQRPDGFSGGVGQFKLSATVDKQEVSANDPVTIHVTVSGVGNLKLMKQPQVKFPHDFDKYDPKITDKTHITTRGLEGQMQYDFIAVPRNKGSYTIEPVELTFFDTSTNSYRTLKSQPIILNVKPGKGGSRMSDYSKNDIELLNKDIHFIKKGEPSLRKRGDYFFGSAIYWAMCLAIILAFIVLLVVFRNRALAAADIVGTRGKKANKVATKRLRRAAKLMFAGKQGEFYDEVLRALWGYVSDKLNMPVEQLSKDNIADRLSERQIDAQTITAFIDSIDECEFARYAPGDPRGKMDKVYEKAMNAITEIDNTLAMRKKTAKPVSAVLLLLMFFTMTPAFAASPAETKAQADSAYVKEDYQTAAKLYEQVLKGGEDAAVYYNLGNAYFRMEELTRAIICYERSLKLDPSDDDTRFNLQLARSKTIDKIEPASEMFFITWYRSMVNAMSIDARAIQSLVFLVVALISLLLFLFVDRVLLRKIALGAFALCVLLCIYSIVMAWQQKHWNETSSAAVVTASSTTVKSSPSANSQDSFVLHEGTHVDITDGSMQEWKEIKLTDGKQGWIATKDIEEI